MKHWLLDNDRIKRASQYATAAILCVLILCLFFRLWRADLRIPFQYNGDALLHAMFIKTIIDTGWYWQNPSLGAPHGLEMYDFPAVENSAAIIFRLLSVFTNNPFVVLNIFYLLTFPLVTLSSLYVFRRFGLSYVPSLFCSLVYTFLPYHFMRNENHLFLSAYYLVPLAVMVMLWISSAESLRRRRFIFSVVICVLLGSNGVYYPFFSCFLLLVAGILGSIKLKKLRPLATAGVLVLITFGSVVINLAPSLIYIYQHGNARVVERSPAGAEIYGLKIAQLVLPITGHRISKLDNLKKAHNVQTLFTENDAASLGLVGTIGFLALIAQLFWREDILKTSAPGLFHDLSMFNIFAVLLATIGGFGLLFALVASAAIRSYNRISIFIGFFSLFAVAAALEWIYQRAVKVRLVFYAGIAVLFLLAFLDQTTPSYGPDYSGRKADYLNDAEFVRKIEASVPVGSMIYQLPYIPFPEYPKVHEMVDYDHFRGYLHSKTLRWSYGTMKNRDGDLWQQSIAALPLDEFLPTLTFAGFSGIYLDRRGYEDGGAAKQSELTNVLRVQPFASADNRLLFFDLADYTRRLHEKYADSEWQTKHELSVHPLLLNWTGGFSGLETSPDKTWRWCSNEGELHLSNTSRYPRKVSLEMSFASGYEQSDDLIISGLISERLKTNVTPSVYSKTITVAPGEAVIKFTSTAKRVDAPRDPRVLVFRVENFKVKALD